jgi:hypothetical protein
VAASPTCNKVLAAGLQANRTLETVLIRAAAAPQTTLALALVMGGPHGGGTGSLVWLPGIA